MFAILTVLSSSAKTFKNYSRTAPLQNEDAPVFHELPDGDMFDLKDRYLNEFNSINTTAGNRRAREFYYCSLILKGLSISNSYAFGAGICVSSGSLSITGSSETSPSTFSNNMASQGGAIATLDTLVVLIGLKEVRTKPLN